MIYVDLNIILFKMKRKSIQMAKMYWMEKGIEKKETLQNKSNSTEKENEQKS